LSKDFLYKSKLAKTKVIPMAIETCPVCNVQIEDGAKVLFSAGPSGTRARLYARVCRYVEKPDCINQGDHEISSKDCYD
jgi:hypothetical protein